MVARELCARACARAKYDLALAFVGAPGAGAAFALALRGA